MMSNSICSSQIKRRFYSLEISFKILLFFPIFSQSNEHAIVHWSSCAVWCYTFNPRKWKTFISIKGHPASLYTSNTTNEMRKDKKRQCWLDCMLVLVKLMGKWNLIKNFRSIRNGITEFSFWKAHLHRHTYKQTMKLEERMESESIETEINEWIKRKDWTSNNALPQNRFQ